MLNAVLLSSVSFSHSPNICALTRQQLAVATSDERLSIRTAGQITKSQSIFKRNELREGPFCLTSQGRFVRHRDSDLPKMGRKTLFMNTWSCLVMNQTLRPSKSVSSSKTSLLSFQTEQPGIKPGTFWLQTRRGPHLLLRGCVGHLLIILCQLPWGQRQKSSRICAKIQH